MPREIELSGRCVIRVIAWLALAGPGALAAQQANQPQPALAASAKRPQVCLVLSGGGARGAAHVGVLKALEEMRIPIDCIAGTSMGSIVGGSYASGTSIADMEATIATMSTRLLFKDQPPREERAIRLKRDDQTNLAAPEIGLRDGQFLLPMGVVSGIQLETVLRRLSKVHGFRRFDELPIPFRAVATDLVTGKPVVLRQGELASAMRASMSVPAAIDPVPLDGHLLVDGGLTNNLPVDVARAMGADIVIAVNLGTPLLKASGLTSVLGVTGQMVNILTDQNVQASLAGLKPSDILVLPQLGDYSAVDFDHMPQTVPLGYSAVRAVADLLSRLSVPQADYDSWNIRRQSGASPALQVAVDEIRFDNLQRVNPAIARSVMETQPGVPLEQETLDKDMRRLFGTGDFEHVNYRLLEEPGRRILAIDAVEKSWGPNFLRAGLGLSSDFNGDAFFNVLGSFRKTWLNSLGAEWRTDLQFGRTNRVATEFYQPLEASQSFFIAPSIEYERRPLDVFLANERVAQYEIHALRGSLELGFQSKKFGQIRLGLTAAEMQTTLDTGSPILEQTESRSNYAGFTLRSVVDQLDSGSFPRSGYAMSLNATSARASLGSDADFSRADFTGNYVMSFGEHTFNLAAKAGRRFGSSTLPAPFYFQWGGLLQQSGYRTGALMGEELQFARIFYYNRLARFSFLDGVYGGVSLEVGRVGRPLIPNNEQGTLRSAALLLGVDTPLGPLYLGYGRADRGYNSLYLYLGRP
ncbi:patatin-like phospholipase family protein [uncultured Ramlibacter sp.]|uniref:patatin-like phospholipase family protein n=1 Tax=uncultured Ramlibacter sp. TaxID=260755 RepID=UPI002607D3A6|nr:patatin-like phospholipase family protein [uncultured Ramlibacter sp.]